MTTCYRFDRDPVREACRTCGRPVEFVPSAREGAHYGDGAWRHTGESVAVKLAMLEARRRKEATR